MGYVCPLSKKALHTDLPTSNVQPASPKMVAKPMVQEFTQKRKEESQMVPESWQDHWRRGGLWRNAPAFIPLPALPYPAATGLKRSPGGFCLCHPHPVPCKCREAFCPLLRVCHGNEVTVARGSSGSREQRVLETRRIHTEGPVH